MSEGKTNSRSRRRHKLKSNRKWPLIVMFLLAAALVAAGGATVYRAQHAVVTAAPGIPEEIQIGQELLRQSIREEFKTNFAPPEETVVEHLPEARIRVSGWVDVVTGTGSSDRQNYSIVIFRNGAGDWVGDKISVLPQM